MRFGGSAADALAAFGDGLVGKTDDGEGRHAGADLDPDVDRARSDALESNRRDPREHAITPRLACPYSSPTPRAFHKNDS